MGNASVIGQEGVVSFYFCQNSGSYTAFGATDDGTRASAIELAFEALYLSRKISKDSGEGTTIYG